MNPNREEERILSDEIHKLPPWNQVWESCLFTKGIGETLNLSASYPENLKTEFTPLHMPPSSWSRDVWSPQHNCTLPKKISCFVSRYVSLDISFPSVRQEPSFGHMPLMGYNSQRYTQNHIHFLKVTICWKYRISYIANWNLLLPVSPLLPSLSHSLSAIAFRWIPSDALFTKLESILGSDLYFWHFQIFRFPD